MKSGKREPFLTTDLAECRGCDALVDQGSQRLADLGLGF